MGIPIIITIDYNENCGGEISARFEAVDKPKPVAQVKMGVVVHDVTGWSESGACGTRGRFGRRRGSAHLRRQARHPFEKIR